MIKVSAMMCGICKVELVGPMCEIHCPKCGYIPTTEDIQKLLKLSHDEFTEGGEQNE